MKEKSSIYFVLGILIVVIVGAITWTFLFKKEPSIIEEKMPLLETKIKKTVKIQGYFLAYNDIDWGDKPVVCNTVIVTKVAGGDATLIEDLKQLVDDGNTVNSIDKEGNLILNIEFFGLTPEQKKKIQSSTAINPVELDIIDIRSNEGTEVSTCASFVDILKDY